MSTLVHFLRRFKNLRKELTVYMTLKSTIRFPLDKAIPLDLINRIIKFRITETSEKTETKTV